MDMNGEQRLPASREAVWKALNDPDVLRQCIPGCEEIERISETELTAKVTTKIGPMKARFSGKVFLEDLDPPNAYTIRGEGQGGAAGFAKGSARVALEADGPETTVLRYTAHGNVGGKLAQLGSRLIDSTARKMADEFFGRFAEIMSGGATPGGEPVVAPEPAAAPATPAGSAPAGRGLNPWLWGIGLIVIVAVLLAIFTR